MRARLAVYPRLLGYLRPYWIQVVIAYAAMLLATGLNLIVPQILAAAIDQGVDDGSAYALFVAGLIILGIAVVRGIVGFGQRYYGEWLTHRVAYDLRNDFYSAVQSLPFAFHDKAHTGDLMSRATSDITESERFAGIGLLDLCATVILLVGVVVAMFLENVMLTVMVLGPLIALVATAVHFGNIVNPMFKRIQEQMGVLSSVMQESLTGIGVVKAFAREPYERQKFETENDKWFEKRYEAIRVWGHYWPLFSLILAAAVVVLLWFGGPMAIDGTISVGSLFAMISYVLMLNAPVSRLGFIVNMAATAGASAGRVFEIMDTPRAVHDEPGAVELGAIQGQIEFDHVSFAYHPGQSALTDITFTAKPDQIIALIGPTGSGKSTITSLIPRFYDPTAGRVLVDGQDIREVTLPSLRGHIGMVLQSPFLFNSTIAENIAYGRPDAPMAIIEAAARAAAAHDFIVSFPNGYETIVGERGVSLSGGQKQRVAIARALVCDPRILILDDSTSSVDTETEHLIQQALATLMHGRTTVIIAQRLLTLRSADMILVLDHGRIVERGTHDELLRQQGLYREIYDLQLRDQEEFVQMQQNGAALPAAIGGE